MPLIDYNSDLTNLKYGGDLPGGGDSGQPYITPQTINPILFDTFSRGINGSDSFVRGGALTFAGPLTTTPAGDIDRARIKAFMDDPAKGGLFLQKQTDLQKTNPNLQLVATQKLNFSTLENLVNSLNSQPLAPTQQFDDTGRNMLAQIASQGTGVHLKRHGAYLSVADDPTQTYEYFVSYNNDESSNRLLLLQQTKLTGLINVNGIAFANAYGISNYGSELFNYQGGPGSTYGDGFTSIGKYTSTEKAIAQTSVDGVAYSNLAFSYSQIAAQTTGFGTTAAHPNLQDFRAQLPDDSTVYNEDYADYNLETRYGVGNPGAADDRTSYNDVKPQAIDSVNATGLYYYDTTKYSPWDAPLESGNETKDLIKFTFECMSNDFAGDAIAIVMRAFMDGGITDTNQAEYNTFKYLGRGETFRTYQGFDRSISFSFKMFVQTRSEMQTLYKKLNHLMTQVYPDYSPTSNLMRGSVVRLTIGDYLYRIPGFLENVNITIDENSSWETLLNSNQQDDDYAVDSLYDRKGHSGDYSPGVPILYPRDIVQQLPHLVSIQCSFKPIMDLLPRRENSLNPFVPLISRENYLGTPIEYIENPTPQLAPGTIVTRPTPDLIIGTPTGPITGTPIGVIPSPTVQKHKNRQKKTKHTSKGKATPPPTATPTFFPAQQEDALRDKTNNTMYDGYRPTNKQYFGNNSKPLLQPGANTEYQNYFKTPPPFPK